ncbi:MAG: class C beta-lactamase-related serine hydrolase [Gemmatimonadetes bacterium]|nr:class C beta-lactamase-related serine hydrolase [Gemmatimonadota bacterium]
MAPLLRLATLLAIVGFPGYVAGQRPTSSGWPATTPAAAGINGRTLDSLDAEITRGDYGNVDRMLVIRGGKIAFDKSYQHDYATIYADSAKTKNALNAGDPTGPYNYFNPWWHPYYRRGRLHTLQSVTKTITSVVIGTAVLRGDFPSVDTPVLSFFDTTAITNIDDRKRRMTVRHLLTMTGGFDWNENLPYIDPRNNGAAMEASRDWVEYTINLPMAREPGAEFNYSSGETELLAHIFRRATGQDIEEYAAKHLFGPLGIADWHWKRIPTGLIDTEGGLYLEARDLAKIWQLFLGGGVWQGTRIVSAEWVKASVTPAVRAGNRAGTPYYGLKWWLHQNPADTTKLVWSGSGFGGQLPMAFPERDLVVVFNGWNILPGGTSLPLRRVMERLVKAVPVDR